MKVDVYWNLHYKCWSVRHKGRVQYHAFNVVLRDVRFVVQKAGRDRVLREGRKNVHAFARGEMVSTKGADFVRSLDHTVTYNPYKDKSFVTVVDGNRIPVDGAATVLLATVNGKPVVYTEDAK